MCRDFCDCRLLGLISASESYEINQQIFYSDTNQHHNENEINCSATGKNFITDSLLNPAVFATMYRTYLVYNHRFSFWQNIHTNCDRLFELEIKYASSGTSYLLTKDSIIIATIKIISIAILGPQRTYPTREEHITRLLQ